MAPNVGIDLGARLVEPRPLPGDAIAQHAARHAGQPRHAGTTQGLQQQRFGLIALMVREQHDGCAMRQRHLAQHAVARLARPGFDALAFRGAIREPFGHELNRLAGPRPTTALRLAVREPRIGMRAQTVMHVERDRFDAMVCRRRERRMQQCRRIATAAIGDRDATALTHVVGACQLCLVSLNRPDDCSRS